MMITRKINVSLRCLRLFAGLVLATCLLCSDAVAATLFDPKTGYRIKHYRAPLPESVPGGRRVLSDEVEKLHSEKKVIFLDVMPSVGGGAHPKTGVWRITKPRKNIPGSTWLPDVGQGRISARMLTYLENNLARLTENDKTRAILIYCQSDCWMGWNAVQRISKLGYTNILWFAEGTDGWTDWNGELEASEPVPVQPAS